MIFHSPLLVFLSHLFSILGARTPGATVRCPLRTCVMPRVSRRHFLQNLAAVSAASAALPRLVFGAERPAAATDHPARELRCDVLVIGGSLGGIAAALAAARMGRTVIVTEETTW